MHIGRDRMQIHIREIVHICELNASCTAKILYRKLEKVSQKVNCADSVPNSTFICMSVRYLYTHTIGLPI
jgi:hypothetical protein